MSGPGDNWFHVAADGRVTSGTVNLGPDVRYIGREGEGMGQVGHLIAFYVCGHRYYGGLGSNGSYSPATVYVGEIIEKGRDRNIKVRHRLDFSPHKPRQ